MEKWSFILLLVSGMAALVLSYGRASIESEIPRDQHYLYYTIMELYRSNEQDAAEIMSAIQILRPYGQVGSLDWEKQGKLKVGFGVKDYGAIETLADEIKTFNEQIEDKDLIRNIHGAINAAQRIVFLGFHFHKQNMELMMVTDDAQAIRPAVIATVLGRSPPDQEMIKQRITNMTGAKRPPKSIETFADGCRGLFRNFGSTWM